MAYPVGVIIQNTERRRKEHKKKGSNDKAPVPRISSFKAHVPPGSMIKDYSWMEGEATDNSAATEQSNPKVIAIDEQSESDDTIHHNRLLGNPFTDPGDMVAGPYGHGSALPSNHPKKSDDHEATGEEFFSMVKTLVGIIALFKINADNNPHSEILSGENFAIPKVVYPAPYIPADFQGLYLPQQDAPGILTCQYHNTSLRDHPLHSHSHSYTEGSDRVGMYPS